MITPFYHVGKSLWIFLFKCPTSFYNRPNDIIVIDQPEDDLDNKVIYDEVITAIAKKKPNIQFLFATHNANIPVLGDAERVFVVEFQDTKIDVSQGNIDLGTTHKQIVDIMEGGKEAFDKRQLIYTSWR